MVTFGELQYGALKSNNAPKALHLLEELKNYIPVLPCSIEVADQYADIRADLSKRGEIIGNNDLWIAAHARNLDYILVSNNIKEFKKVKGLHLENWI
jgi:tRNA(fMet)-specific endonuclease VapC